MYILGLFFPISVKNAIEMIEIAMILYYHMGKTNILTILIFQIYEYGLSFHLFVSSTSFNIIL